MMNRKKGIMISVAVIAVIGAAAFILGGRGGEEEYESLYQQMVDGTLVVDDDYTVMDNAETATNWSNVNVNII